MNKADLFSMAISVYVAISVIIAAVAALGFVIRARNPQIVGYGGIIFVLLGAMIMWMPMENMPVGPTDQIKAWILLLTGSFAFLVPLTGWISQRNVQRRMKKLGDDMQKDPAVDPQTAVGAARLLNDLAKQKHY